MKIIGLLGMGIKKSNPLVCGPGGIGELSRGVKAGVRQSTNFEILNPKQIRITKAQNSKLVDSRFHGNDRPRSGPPRLRHSRAGFGAKHFFRCRPPSRALRRINADNG